LASLPAFIQRHDIEFFTKDFAALGTDHMSIVRAGLEKWDNLKRDLPGDPMLGFEDKSEVTDTQTRAQNLWKA